MRFKLVVLVFLAFVILSSPDETEGLDTNSLRMAGNIPSRPTQVYTEAKGLMAGKENAPSLDGHRDSIIFVDALQTMYASLISFFCLSCTFLTRKRCPQLWSFEVAPHVDQHGNLLGSLGDKSRRRVGAWPRPVCWAGLDCHSSRLIGDGFWHNGNCPCDDHQ